MSDSEFQSLLRGGEGWRGMKYSMMMRDVMHCLP